jgi:predicted DNA-binding protein
MTTRTPKSEMIFARADKKLVERLHKVSTRIDRPSSQIVREAVKAELDRIEGKAK